MKARGKREAKRSASPLVKHKAELGLKGRNMLYYALSGLRRIFILLTRGDVPTKLGDLPLAFIFRALHSGHMTHKAKRPTILIVAVVGTGVIGRSWVQVFVRAGCQTRVYDRDRTRSK